MKITHVLPALTKGGGERVAVELVNQSKKLGYDVSIVCGYKVSEHLLEKELLPGTVILFVSSSPFTRYISILGWILKHRTWLKQKDIIHCHLTYGAVFGTLFQITSRFWHKRPKVIETYHAVGMAIPKFKRWIHARLLRKRDALILMAHDEYWSEYLNSNPNLYSKVIKNGVNVEQFKTWDETYRISYKKEIGIPNGCKFLVGTIGMLRTDRQPWRYIPIFSKLSKTLGESLHFFIGGSGPELDRIKGLIKEYELEGQVHLPGLILDPSLPLSILDVYISLQIGDITGISMLEAAVAGVPIVGIQLLNNYKSKETDWIWSSSNDTEIVDRIIKLLTFPKLRDETIEKQKMYVRQNLSSEKMTKDYIEVYKSLLS